MGSARCEMFDGLFSALVDSLLWCNLMESIESNLSSILLY